MTFVNEKKAVQSLEDICVRWICKNIRLMTYVERTPNQENKRRWRFPYQNYHILARPAQKILFQLCKRKILTDEHMYLFQSDYVDLMSPTIRESKIGPTSLRVLKDFHLYNLAAINLENLNLNGIIGCLGELTVRDLISLNISGTSILCETKLPIVVSLARFKSLNILNVSRTEVTTQCLQIIVNDLPELRYLDISRTRVKDISALLAIKHRLNGLFMHRLEIYEPEAITELMNTIIELSELRFLDASDKARITTTRCPKVDMLCSPEVLPHLVHIDLSGNQFGLKIDDANVQTSVEKFQNNLGKLRDINQKRRQSSLRINPIKGLL